jgi:hypothetical protein
MTRKSTIAVDTLTSNYPGMAAKDIEMTQDNAKEGDSILYWITLGIMFAAFFAVAVS